ncbi:SURF1 family protein [Cellulomonas aerilata]|uniref:SURF1-like protein n=1 Tax=Cellulomonas aerilata TaxID=515326 RepID=A0A512D8X5_9CELL|nr:SURF1 family protein [Cellulomonas aerilata]GEO32942.1 SURF1-like protein [Cellulomonas aerilata]
MEDREPTSLLRAAVRPRMLVLLVVLLVAAALCARLGVWQLDRAHVRAQAGQAAGQEAPGPVPLDEVLAPQTTFDGGVQTRPVTATGTYEADRQLVVEGRVVDGRPAYLVLTPLRVDGAVLPVVRGWVSSPDDDAALAVPDGEVVVTGYLRASEQSGTLDPGAGTTDAISSAQLVNVWGGPIYSGYLALTDAQPAQPSGPTPLPPPVADEGGWDLRNLGYAAQWWIFGLFALGLWVRMVRDEARGDVQDEPVVTTPTGADASP